MIPTTKIGTITKLELIKSPKGHIPRVGGCGFYRNRKADRKLRRLADKEYAK
jgi:hypothetical protein